MKRVNTQRLYILNDFYIKVKYFFIKKLKFFQFFFDKSRGFSWGKVKKMRSEGFTIDRRKEEVMQIHSDYRGKVLYMRLSGEMDEHNAASVRRAADRLADDFAGSERAVIDLKDVSFMDSTGIGFLIGRYKKFRRYGIPVYVTNPNLGTDKILQMSGVYTLMPKI